MDENFPCEKCDSIFSNKYSLAAHMKMSHRGTFYCSMCSYSFLTKDEVKLHEENDHSDWEKYSNYSVGDEINSPVVS